MTRIKRKTHGKHVATDVALPGFSMSYGVADDRSPVFVCDTCVRNDTYFISRKDAAAIIKGFRESIRKI